MASFCGKCGCKLNADDKFCAVCGAQVDDGSSEKTLALDEPLNGGSVKSGSFYNEKKQKGKIPKWLILLLAAICIFLIVAGALFGYQYYKESNNILNYITFEEKGCTGYGEIDYIVSEKLYKKAIGSKDYNDNNYSEAQISEIFDALNVNVSNNGKLLNGDIAEISVVVDNVAAQKYGLKFKNANLRYEVKNLIEPADIDILKNIKVTFDGFNKYAVTQITLTTVTGKITVPEQGVASDTNIAYSLAFNPDNQKVLRLTFTDKTGENEDFDIPYYISKQEKIENGDIIEISVDDTYFEQIESKYFVNIPKSKKSITVNGLEEDPKILSEVSEDDLTQAYTDAYTQAEKYILENWKKMLGSDKASGKNKELDNPKICSTIYIKPDKGAAHLYFIYSIETSDSKLDSEVKYYAAHYKNAQVKDGKISMGNNSEFLGAYDSYEALYKSVIEKYEGKALIDKRN